VRGRHRDGRAQRVAEGEQLFRWIVRLEDREVNDLLGRDSQRGDLGDGGGERLTRGLGARVGGRCSEHLLQVGAHRD